MWGQQNDELLAPAASPPHPAASPGTSAARSAAGAGPAAGPEDAPSLEYGAYAATEGAADTRSHSPIGKCGDIWTGATTGASYELAIAIDENATGNGDDKRNT